MCDVQITSTDTSRISVASPYNKEFVVAARNLAGKWDADSQVWTFDRRVEADVRALCVKLFGTDGTSNATCSVLVTYPDGAVGEKQGISILNRTVARAFGRDSGARLGDNVILRDGKIKSGSSRNNWETIITEGSVFVIHDVNLALAQQAQLAEHNDHGAIVTIIDDKTETQEKLREEKEVLLARIVEIDMLLADL